MFICPKCKSKFMLPACENCGYVAAQKNNIWLLTEMPDMITEGDGEKYIGYEHIGEYYSGSKKYEIAERDAIYADELSKITRSGVFLDLACGDGCITVPCAKNGTKIIAGDISNNMMSILQRRAFYNNISLENVTLCRMNAYEIPLEDESIDTVTANSMLHLLSNPENVVSEILRVLKKCGVFACIDDRPGVNKESQFDNSQYNDRVMEICKYYWDKLRANGIVPKKYSWKFDQNSLCEKLFTTKDEKLIQRGNYFEIPMKDGFLPRFFGRGFSDQAAVPQEMHEMVITQLNREFIKKYGEDYANLSFKGVEDDLLITFYIK